jgi:hypothetical protein
MSDELVLEQPSHVRSQPEKNDPPAVVLSEEPTAKSGPTPEEALEASRKAIQAAEDQARTSQQREQQTSAELERMRASQQQDQVAVLSSAVEASTAERDRHSHAWQAAMEAGDWAAAAKHNSDMAMATARLERATGDLAMAKAGAEQRRGQPRQQQQNSISQASQNWINSHNQFNRHRDALLLKHQELLNDGIQADSPRYFRELDTEYDRLTGGGQQQERDMGGRVSKPQQFDGGTPSRGSGGGSQGGTVRTMLGDVHVRTVNGQTLIQIPPEHRELFNTGAKDCGMSVADYAMEQVTIAREIAAGGTGGLITSEGKNYK